MALSDLVREDGGENWRRLFGGRWEDGKRMSENSWLDSKGIYCASTYIL